MSEWVQLFRGGLTWPELVALELMNQEERARRKGLSGTGRTPAKSVARRSLRPREKMAALNLNRQID